MCGIVGVFSTFLTKREKDIFKFLLSIDVVRGADSTGAIGVFKKTSNDETSVKYAKVAGPPHNLFGTKGYDAVLDSGSAINRTIALIGHNRAATRGEVSSKNAHPFRHNHITLVHNGTLASHWDPTLDSKRGKQFEVDSEALTWGIAKHGIDKVYKTLTGAATIVWWDNKDKAIKWITNGDRPFWFCTSSTGREIFFASEKWMLEAAKSKFNISLNEKGILTPAHHNLFNHGITAKGDIDQWGGKLENNPVPYPKIIHNNNYGQHGYYGGHYAQGGYPQRGCQYPTAQQKTHEQKLVNNEKKIVNLLEFKGTKAPQNGDLPKHGLFRIHEVYKWQVFQNKFDSFCQVCNKLINYTHDYVLDTQTHSGICSGCYEELPHLKGKAI